jgi:dienelactone hydrolase
VSTTALRRILLRVTALQRYIAEEIATDHVDGLLTRREALRRLALLGIGAAAAAGELIAACAKREGAINSPKPTATESSTGSAQPPGAAHTLPAAAIAWAGPRGQDHAFFNDTGPRYNAGASADAWQRLLNWLGRYLAGQ